MQCIWRRNMWRPLPLGYLLLKRKNRLLKILWGSRTLAKGQHRLLYAGEEHIIIVSVNQFHGALYIHRPLWRYRCGRKFTGVFHRSVKIRSFKNKFPRKIKSAKIYSFYFNHWISIELRQRPASFTIVMESLYCLWVNLLLEWTPSRQGDYGTVYPAKEQNKHWVTTATFRFIKMGRPKGHHS